MTTATLARRLGRLEADLSPKQAVLLWLTEAHGFPTLTDYVISLIGGSESAWPLVRLPRQVEASVRAAHRGQTPALAVAAVNAARGEVVSLVEFVLQANLAAEEVLGLAAVRLESLQRHKEVHPRTSRGDVLQVLLSLDL